MKSLSWILLIIILASGFKRHHIYVCDPEESQCITVIDPAFQEIRYIIDGKHDSVPDSNYIKLKVFIGEIPSDVVYICWKNDSYEWEVLVRGAKVIENRLDQDRYLFRNVLEKDERGVPTADPDAGRRAYFDYLQGELLHNDGQIDRARKAFQQVLDGHPEQEAAVRYSRLGLARSYLTESSPDSLRRGQFYLRQVVRHDPDTTARRYALEVSVRGYIAQGDRERALVVAEQLRQMGNTRQRALSTVQWLHMNIGALSNPEILRRLDELEDGEPTASVEQEVMYLRSMVLEEYGLPEQAAQVQSELKRKHPESLRSRQGERRLQRSNGGGRGEGQGPRQSDNGGI